MTASYKFLERMAQERFEDLGIDKAIEMCVEEPEVASFIVNPDSELRKRFFDANIYTFNALYTICDYEDILYVMSHPNINKDIIFTVLNVLDSVAVGESFANKNIQPHEVFDFYKNRALDLGVAKYRISEYFGRRCKIKLSRDEILWVAKNTYHFHYYVYNDSFKPLQEISKFTATVQEYITLDKMYFYDLLVALGTGINAEDYPCDLIEDDILTDRITYDELMVTIKRICDTLDNTPNDIDIDHKLYDIKVINKLICFAISKGWLQIFNDIKELDYHSDFMYETAECHTKEKAKLVNDFDIDRYFNNLVKRNYIKGYKDAIRFVSTYYYLNYIIKDWVKTKWKK